MKRLLLVLACAACLSAQELDPAKLLKPGTDSWPNYNGDYSGRRYSPLAQINQSNVGSLTLAWAFQTHGTPAFSASALAVALSPIALIAFAGGPMKTRPALAQAAANAAFSERKP